MRNFLNYGSRLHTAAILLIFALSRILRRLLNMLLVMPLLLVVFVILSLAELWRLLLLFLIAVFAGHSELLRWSNSHRKSQTILPTGPVSAIFQPSLQALNTTVLTTKFCAAGSLALFALCCQMFHPRKLSYKKKLPPVDVVSYKQLLLEFFGKDSK